MDAVVVRIASNGAALSLSTFLGGSGIEQAWAAAVDASGWIYVTGSTTSDNFPTRNPLQASRGGDEDAFVTQFYTSGADLYYSTYLGGSREDTGYGLAVDEIGCAYVAGKTFSTDFPTATAFQPGIRSYPASSAFASKLSVNGQSLEYSTYLGGSGYGSSAQDIALNEYKQAYVTGYTSASDFPTVNPLQAGNRGGTDVYVSLFASDGQALLFSTYLGGSLDDDGYGIAVDPYYGDSHVCGVTRSPDFPLESPYQDELRGVRDAFYFNLNADGDRLHYSTYLGGSAEWDSGLAIAFKDRPDERVWLAGDTDSADFPLRRAFQGAFGGGDSDAFLAGFAWGEAPAANRYHTDFNGDGTSDIAIFRSAAGLWSVRGLTRLYFGTSADSPVPADFNGDGTTEIAIFRPANGLWSVRGLTRLYFGAAYDQPRPGDYNGDGTAAAAVFRGNSGLWAIRGLTRAYFGSSLDRPLPGPYRGQAASDLAVFRSSSSLWAIRGWSRIYFGSTWDHAVPGDYNGNGAWAPAIFRSAAGLWSVRGLTRLYFGSASDLPVPADYNGGGADAEAVFRGSSGLWAVRGLTRVYHGASGDLPVTR